MNLYHVTDLPTWKQAPKAARSEFIEAMRPCDYGAAPTRDAWDWFIIGFMAAYPLTPPAPL